MSALSYLYNRVILALAALAGAIVAAACAVVLIDVSLRTVGVPVPAFAITFAEYAMLYIAMCAAPWLVRERGHVYIDLIVRVLPPTVRRGAERVIYVIAMTACSIMMVTGFDIFWEAFNSDRTDVRGIEVPLWISLLPLPVGFGLVTLEFLRLFVRGESYFDRGSEGRGSA
jgi:TRAP-type C4-dicarboxylate transport system permease small subunit